MTWPPNCSQDVTEARELTGEEEQRALADQLLHEQYCMDGFLGENALDQAIPCHHCHPGLRDRLSRSRWSA